MKNLLFTFTLFLIVNFSFAQTKIENDLSKYGLKGKVSFFSESKYDLVEKFGKIEKGNMIERNEYNADGSLSSKQTYKYDVKGNKIEGKHYIADGILSDKYTYKCEFDAMGNWIKKTIINDDKPKDLTERVIEYY